MKKLSTGKLVMAVVVVLAAALSVAFVETRPNINSEDSSKLTAELVSVDGIGEYLATEIVSARPYASWDDLKQRIDGVGDVRIKAIKEKFNLLE